MTACLRGRGKRSRRRYVKLTDANGKATEVPVMKIMVDVWLHGGKPCLIPFHKNGDLNDNYVGNISFTTKEKLGKMTAGRKRNASLSSSLMCQGRSPVPTAPRVKPAVATL